jgi:putative aldouronate transport system substrate-binding protein
MTWASTGMNSHWRFEFGIDYMNRKSSLTWNNDPGFAEYLYGKAITDYMIPFTPEDVPIALLHTTAENEEWAETRTNIQNYANQCLALFATGQMDADRDWDTYINNLKSMGNDQLLAMDQAAYARTLKAYGK